ncbi:hypothetical protein [Chachezhania sediminis]|uniref:hypothetical protein n=1 Tax=Chachezhania sediminis TaxID=2599291 RepID=UPI00131B494E|nr:hypothetical protein [Chachezhania sediminis]
MVPPVRLALALSSALFLAPPALAQEAEDGPSKIQQGLSLFLDGLREEAAPTLQSLQDLMREAGPRMQDFVDQMGPALTELANKVDDWAAYETPEILPNGDILIRRKPEKPEEPPEAPTVPHPLDPDTATDL